MLETARQAGRENKSRGVKMKKHVLGYSYDTAAPMPRLGQAATRRWRQPA